MINDNKFGYNSYPFNYNPTDYYKKLEQENIALKEQMRQSQFVDPQYVEFQQTPEYQNAKKDNLLTYIFANVFSDWQASELGRQFAEWDKKQFEKYKAIRMAKTNPTQNPMPNPTFQ